MADHLRTELVLSALEMALWNRRPDPGAVHHSDHGCQYTSLAFGQRCQEAGVVPSLGSRGDCYDNAITESFFASLECELLDRSAFRTRNEARTAIFDYIEAFYNTHRRHSALGYLSPAEFERQFIQEAAARGGSRRRSSRGCGLLRAGAMLRGPLRMGGLLLLPHRSPPEGRPHVHAPRPARKGVCLSRHAVP